MGQSFLGLVNYLSSAKDHSLGKEGRGNKHTLNSSNLDSREIRSVLLIAEASRDSKVLLYMKLCNVTLEINQVSSLK